MSASDYLPLITDSRTLVKTLRRVYGAKPEPAQSLYTSGQSADQFGRIHPDRLKVRVHSRRRETADATTLVLAASEGDLPSWSPGQYVNVFVTIEGVNTSRPMSISSVSGGHLELTVRRKPGGFVSGYLADQLKVGDELLISGPDGDFYYMPVRDGKDLVLIAAGSGITPFMGMSEQILAEHPEVEITLLYGSRSPDEIIFLQRLLAIEARHERFRLYLSVTRPGPGWERERGRIDVAAIGRALQGEAAGKTFFVCGPPAMERDTVANLQKMGVARGRIRVEASGPSEEAFSQRSWPSGVERSQTFQVHLEGRQEPIAARADESLMNAIERAGVSIPARCRSGACGACRTRLKSGQVVRAAGFSLRPSDQDEHYIHACVSHPISDLDLVPPPDIGQSRVRLSPTLRGDSQEFLAATPDLSAAPVSEQADPAGTVASDTIQLPAENKPGIPWFKGALALSGLGFFLYLVLSSGISVEMISAVGWNGFVLLLAVSFGAILTDSLAWRLSLSHLGRPSLRRLLALRIGGDAMTNSLPGGLLLGEPFKALMLRRHNGIKLSDSAASLMTVKFGLGITQSLFVLFGLILITPLLRDRSAELFGFSGAHYVGLAVIAGFMAVLTLLLTAVLRGRSFSALAGALARLPSSWLRGRLHQSAHRFEAVDQSCSRVFTENRQQLPTIFGLLLAGWVFGGLETFVLLRALDQPVSLQTAMAIESVGSMFRLLFFLLPSGIGGQDASLLTLFKLFSLPRSSGGAFVLLKRFKELIWIGVGFVLVLAFRGRRDVVEDKGKKAASSSGDADIPLAPVAVEAPAVSR